MEIWKGGGGGVFGLRNPGRRGGVTVIQEIRVGGGR